jgi:tRNA G18 (ribose-2'-O)-methylase SpoU
MNKTPNYKELIKEMISKHYNVKDEFKDNTVEQNRLICELNSLPFGIGIYNVLGDLNIGIMIRTASLLGARDIILFGRKKYDQRSTVGAENYICVEHVPVDSIDDFNNAFIWQFYYPVFVETFGVPISSEKWDYIAPYDWPTRMNSKIPMFMFGSESNGFGDELTEWIKQSKFNTISIPQRGVLRSFNVSSAMSIISYEYSQYLESQIKLRDSGYP